MSRRDEYLTGVFVLLGVGVIVAGALWLSEARWQTEFQTIEARFETVGRLQPGNRVTLRGVQVGRVDRVDITARGVDVVMRVRQGVPLPQEPVVVARPVSLFGEWAATVESSARHPSLRTDTMATPGGVLPGATASDFAELSDYAGEIASNLQTLTDHMEIAFSEESAENLAHAIENFERASSELVTLMARQRESFGGFAEDMASAGRALRSVSADLDSTVSRLQAATAEGELEAIFDNTRQATASLDRLAGTLEGTATEARSAIARADTALRRAESILTRVEEGRGSLGRLTSDTALYENLSATITELRILLYDLKQNPNKYFKFSIF